MKNLLLFWNRPRRFISATILLTVSFSLHSQMVADASYWVYFKDKNDNGFSYLQPEAFLSQRSIHRRAWQGLPVSHADEPVTPAYLQGLKDLGAEVRHVSRWLNGALVVNAPEMLYEQLLDLSFTDTLPWAQVEGQTYYPEKPGGTRFDPPLSPAPQLDYGWALRQVNITETEELHNRGYTGSGVWVGIADNGFRNVDSLPAFDQIISQGRLLGSRNFVDTSHVFRVSTTHGMRVLSAAGALWEGELVGTAPHASFFLCMTEDPSRETMIEEFAWIEALEFMDSLGVDVVNTSLGYSNFDGDFFDHSKDDLDGQSIFISRVASMAAEKGMICCNSAGNEGNKPWYFITAPGDASDVLTVGAVDSTGRIASFSSRGPTSDGRVKPDIMGLGLKTSLQDISGIVKPGNGTSFSTPLITGSVASLWQAFPGTSATELINAITKSSNSFLSPNEHYGYGIPSFKIAYWTVTDIPVHKGPAPLEIYPNPASEWFLFRLPLKSGGLIRLEYYDLSGKLAAVSILEEAGVTRVPAQLDRGMYILRFHTREGIYHQRLILE